MIDWKPSEPNVVIWLELWQSLRVALIENTSAMATLLILSPSFHFIYIYIQMNISTVREKCTQVSKYHHPLASPTNYQMVQLYRRCTFRCAATDLHINRRRSITRIVERWSPGHTLNTVLSAATRRWWPLLVWSQIDILARKNVIKWLTVRTKRANIQSRWSGDLSTSCTDSTACLCHKLQVCLRTSNMEWAL